MPDVIIIGAGGHAKVVLATALANQAHIAGFLDDDMTLLDKQIAGYSVLGTVATLKEGIYPHAVFGLGHNRTRKQIAMAYHNQNWQTYVHPRAYVHPSVKLGKGTVVFAGAIIQPDVIIGEYCIINTGATIDHDCVIGDYAHIAPGVNVAGGVLMGEGVFLGIGSSVIPEMTIGAWSTVGAGSCVIHCIAAQKTVIGVPAKERINVKVIATT